MEGFSLVQSRGDDGWHFYLKTPNREYHLIAEQDHQRQSWIRAIHRVCSHIAELKGGGEFTPYGSLDALSTVPSPLPSSSLFLVRVPDGICGKTYRHLIEMGSGGRGRCIKSMDL